MNIKLVGVSNCSFDSDKSEVTIEIPFKPLTHIQSQVLKELFPDLDSAIEHLLVKQMILHHIE